MSAEVRCTCPHTDGYRIRNGGCPVHGEADRLVFAAKAAERQREDDTDCSAAWSDYRKDYGVPPDYLSAAHKAFRAGWTAALQGDQSGVLR